MTVAIKQFKATDTQAVKVDTAISQMTSAIQSDRSALKTNCLDCYVLGDVLYTLNAHPLASVLTQEIFRVSMRAITEFFKKPGTFEFYLSVFRAIWGEDVSVEFTIPFPGKLVINIDAASITNYTLQARIIELGVYNFYDLLTTDTADNIVVRDQTGIKTQAEVDNMMRELNPRGFVIETNLI